MSIGLLALGMLLFGAGLGWLLSVIVNPRAWHPRLRRLRRRLLGRSWQPVLLRPYEPPRPPSSS